VKIMHLPSAVTSDFFLMFMVVSVFLSVHVVVVSKLEIFILLHCGFVLLFLFCCWVFFKFYC